MKFLLKYWNKYRFLFITSVICVSFEAVCDLIQPQIMARLIDNGVRKLDMQYVIHSAMLMLSITAIGAVFACVRNVLSSNASQSFGADVRSDLFIKIQKLSVTDSDKFDGGSLVTRMTNDVTQITNFFNGLMRVFFKAPVMCFGGIFMAFTLNIRTVPIIVSIVVIVIIFIMLSMKLSYPQFSHIQGAIDKLNTTIREYLMGIRLVKAFGRFKHEEERFEVANKRLSAVTTKASRILNAFSPLTSLAVNCGIAVIILLGSHWVGRGEMEVGQIIAFITYMAQILMSLNMISNILNMYVRTKASAVRVAEVMNMEDTENLYAENENTDYDFENIELALDNVSFAYPGSTGEMALKNISFSISKGQTLGIIGPTGSGKSTLASLMLRFYETTGGSINISGYNISDMPASVLRSHIAIVPQTATLFTGSIRDNIAWGENSADDKQITAAAKAAQAYDFITATHEGFNTRLGQGGVNLSGGQKQRVSIARALCGNPDILVLDDCTSALDAVTEAKVRRSLKEYSKDIACVLISQRISSVMTTDKILVLDNGHQVGLGTHERLLLDCPIYRDIYLSQIGGGAKNVG